MGGSKEGRNLEGKRSIFGGGRKGELRGG